MKKIVISTTILLLFTLGAFMLFDKDKVSDNYTFSLDTSAIKFDHNKLLIDNNKLSTVVSNPDSNKNYEGKFVEETVKINISDELYNNYRGVGDVDHTVSLKPVKVAAYNGIISFRYVNNVYTTIDSMDMALDFRLELERSGYKLKINSDKKKVYEGKEYKVVILKEFNYLIIVIIEK